ncbi:Acyl-coenzyme A oxidase (Acyl-CoA oxidase), partial [Halocaridina rubra]
MKHSQVLQDGTYNPPLHGKLAYISMVNVRVSLVAGCCALLKKAVTIATRYSAVRHQSELIPGAPEPQILDYLTQQYKLIPHIASVFALHFASHSLSNLYAIALARLDEGEVDMLPELHAMSCGVKVIGGIDATEGIEICRLACGGHGYLCSAGFTRFYGAATSIITAEGESTVLWLQVARYLVKSYRAASNGDNLVGSVTYLSSVRQNDGRTLNLTSN